jgi:hypothetical protein
MFFYCAHFAISADGTKSLNPGNLKTPLQRHVPGWQYAAFSFALHTPIHGAYTELFAGLSPDVTLENNGAWIIPWGRSTPFGKISKLVQRRKQKVEVERLLNSGNGLKSRSSRICDIPC